MKYIKVTNQSGSAIALNAEGKFIRVEPGQSIQVKYDPKLYTSLQNAIQLTFLDIRLEIVEKPEEQKPQKPLKPTSNESSREKTEQKAKSGDRKAGKKS